MLSLTLTAEDRHECFKALAAARKIIENAEKKYRTQSKGGLAKAYEMINNGIQFLEPTLPELVVEMDEVIARMAPGPDRVAATSVFSHIRRLANNAGPELRGTLAEKLTEVLRSPAATRKRAS